MDWVDLLAVQRTLKRMNLWLPRGEGIVKEFGMDMYTLLYLKWITNKDLLSSTGNLVNVMWQPGW